ncbi:hypothetical protein [Nitrolancea hollandica]|uniref:hypothetical protein n=1 Tax=Nitrolancea hollandica TaxID=1206749 RepID=UPI0002FB5CF5|nr:hypothetical protein [Nitrolancea hollandica]
MAALVAVFKQYLALTRLGFWIALSTLIRTPVTLQLLVEASDRNVLTALGLAKWVSYSSGTTTERLTLNKQGVIVGVFLLYLFLDWVQLTPGDLFWFGLESPLFQ